MAAASEPAINEWLKLYNCSSCEELYFKLEQIQAEHKPVEGEHVRFSFQDLKHLSFITSTCDRRAVIVKDLFMYWGANKAAQLIKELRENPPKESFENPVIHQCALPKEYIAMISMIQNVDLPGSKYNPVGMGYYSQLFFHMFFGNYSDFNKHIKKLSEQDLKQTLNKREGYPQFSPLFAPIIGRRMLYIEAIEWLTEQNIRDIRIMYHGCNENKHVKIIEKLLQLGADPNAHDLIGNTPLFYAAHFRYEADKVVSLLLRHGADPNYSGQCTSIFYHMCSAFASEPEHWSLIDLLMSYNAKPKDYEEAMQIRWGMETQYSLEYAVKMRESYPKKKNECERTECEISAVKMCKACRSVVYCTPACQKLDWKFHKPTCMKKRQEKELKNSA